MKRLIIGLVLLFSLTACAGNSTAALVGEWKLVSYGPATDQKLTSPLVATSIVFDPDGGLSGNAGCNEFNGDYEVDDDQITFGPLSSTKRACEAPHGLYEGSIFAVFQDTAVFELNENILTITSADGSTVIVLEKK